MITPRNYSYNKLYLPFLATFLRQLFTLSKGGPILQWILVSQRRSWEACTKAQEPCSWMPGTISAFQGMYIYIYIYIYTYECIYIYRGNNGWTDKQTAFICRGNDAQRDKQINSQHQSTMCFLLWENLLHLIIPKIIPRDPSPTCVTTTLPGGSRGVLERGTPLRAHV